MIGDIFQSFAMNAQAGLALNPGMDSRSPINFILSRFHFASIMFFLSISLATDTHRTRSPTMLWLTAGEWPWLSEHRVNFG